MLSPALRRRHPLAISWRIDIAVAPGNPNYIYAQVASLPSTPTTAAVTPMAARSASGRALMAAITGHLWPALKAFAQELHRRQYQR